MLVLPRRTVFPVCPWRNPGFLCGWLVLLRDGGVCSFLLVFFSLSFSLFFLLRLTRCRTSMHYTVVDMPPPSPAKPDQVVSRDLWAACDGGT